MVKQLLKTTILLLTVFIFNLSCEEKIFTGDVDCSDYGCFLDKPDSVDLIIHWTNRANYDTLYIELYAGTLDEGEFVGAYEIFEDPAYIYVEAEKEYSLKLLYENAYNGEDVWVVDGTKTKLKRVSDYCEKGTCWMADFAEINMRLKY